MKNLLLFALFAAISFSSFAVTACQVKQIDAAKTEMSKNLVVSKSKISFVRFEGGFWTEMLGGNTGTDKITVAHEDMVEVFEVAAKQNGTSDDCTILRVKKTL